MAQVAGPQGPEQHLAAATASPFARTQSPGKHLAVHAPELAIKPHLQILRRYRRPLLLCLEHSDQPTLEDHVHCSARLGNRASFVVRVDISWPATARNPGRLTAGSEFRLVRGRDVINQLCACGLSA